MRLATLQASRHGHPGVRNRKVAPHVEIAAHDRQRQKDFCSPHCHCRAECIQVSRCVELRYSLAETCGPAADAKVTVVKSPRCKDPCQWRPAPGRGIHAVAVARVRDSVRAIVSNLATRDATTDGRRPTTPHVRSGATCADVPISEMAARVRTEMSLHAIAIAHNSMFPWSMLNCATPLAAVSPAARENRLDVDIVTIPASARTQRSVPFGKAKWLSHSPQVGHSSGRKKRGAPFGEYSIRKPLASQTG